MSTNFGQKPFCFDLGQHLKMPMGYQVIDRNVDRPKKKRQHLVPSPHTSKFNLAGTTDKTKTSRSRLPRTPTIGGTRHQSRLQRNNPSLNFGNFGGAEGRRYDPLDDWTMTAREFQISPYYNK